MARLNVRKQPFIGVLEKRYSKNMQQIYTRTPMPKWNFNFIEIALWHGCSPVNLLHIFRTPFPKNTSGWLLLNVLVINRIGVILFYLITIQQKMKA